VAVAVEAAATSLSFVLEGKNELQDFGGGRESREPREEKEKETPKDVEAGTPTPATSGTTAGTPSAVATSASEPKKGKPVEEEKKAKEANKAAANEKTLGKKEADLPEEVSARDIEDEGSKTARGLSPEEKKLEAAVVVTPIPAVEGKTSRRLSHREEKKLDEVAWPMEKTARSPEEEQQEEEEGEEEEAVEVGETPSTESMKKEAKEGPKRRLGEDWEKEEEKDFSCELAAEGRRARGRG